MPGCRTKRFHMKLRMWLPYLYGLDACRVCGSGIPCLSHSRRVDGSRSRDYQLGRQGKTNGHIARILDICEATVATHLERIFRKLGVRSRPKRWPKG